MLGYQRSAIAFSTGSATIVICCISPTYITALCKTMADDPVFTDGYQHPAMESGPTRPQCLENSGVPHLPKKDNNFYSRLFIA